MNQRCRPRSLAIAVLVMAGLVTGPLHAQTGGMGSDEGMAMMGGMDTESVPRLPPVVGYADGERIFFVHTEVSDAAIAQTLTDMVGSPVPVVPSLTHAPDSMLANVYAFQNGIQPDGPRGPLNYQPTCLIDLSAATATRRCAGSCWSPGRTKPRRGC